MQAIENKILSRIFGRGRGAAFSKTDFVAEFTETNIELIDGREIVKPGCIYEPPED